MRIEIFVVAGSPARRQTPGHPHGLQHFGIAAAGLGKRQPYGAVAGGLPGRNPRKHLGQQRERDENDGASERGEPDPEVKDEAEAEIERHPGQIEQGGRAHAGQETAHAVQIAQRLQAVGTGSHLQRQPDDGFVHPIAEPLVQRAADAHQHAPADRIEQTLDRIDHGDHDGQPDQRRNTAARQHAIVDLQHEQRAGEHQHVDGAAEQPDGHEGAPACGDSARDRRVRRRGRLASVRFTHGLTPLRSGWRNSFRVRSATRQERSCAEFEFGARRYLITTPSAGDFRPPVSTGRWLMTNVCGPDAQRHARPNPAKYGWSVRC